MEAALQAEHAAMTYESIEDYWFWTWVLEWPGERSVYTMPEI